MPPDDPSPQQVFPTPWSRPLTPDCALSKFLTHRTHEPNDTVVVSCHEAGLLVTQPSMTDWDEG